MKNPKAFSKFIKTLRPLYEQSIRERQEAQRIRHEKLAEQFPSFIERLRPIYDQSVRELFDEIVSPFKQQHRDLFETSLLEVIGQEEREIYHSKLLAHIWERNKNALLSFLRNIEGVDDAFIKNVEESEYDVVCEEQENIDIFIKGRQKKSWVIAVENKVNDKVHNRNNTDMTQITHYREFVKREYKNYTSRLILLSYKDNTKHIERDWIYCDYTTLLKSLLEIDSPDRLVKEYQSTVLGLSCEKGADHPDSVQMSLHSINQFRRLF